MTEKGNISISKEKQSKLNYKQRVIELTIKKLKIIPNLFSLRPNSKNELLKIIGNDNFK